MNPILKCKTFKGHEAEASWQAGLKLAIRDSKQLLELLELELEDEPFRNPLEQSVEVRTSIQDHAHFPLFVTREYVRRMQIGDWNDPLLRQVWVDARERIEQAGFVADPVGDGESEIAPGLLQKYSGRVLLVMTGACAIHCRYCFRRHYPYSTGPRTLSDWQAALDRIETDRSIKEVILSGGDPLTIVDSTLAQLVSRLDEIEHLERLRIHTRLPVVLPQRVDRGLLNWLGSTRLSKWVVVHINHAQEIDHHVQDAMTRLRSTGATVLNQAVLLREINDTVEIQETLCKRLLQNSVIPYYLNQLDPVQGAAHFETEIATGKMIVRELAKRLPGYGVPRFVQEQPGQPNKIRID